MNDELYSTTILKKAITLVNTLQETQVIQLKQGDRCGLRTIAQDDGSILYTLYKIVNRICYCSTFKVKNKAVTQNAGSGLESEEILEDKLYFKYKRCEKV